MKNPKFVFAAVFLGFQVHLLNPPTVSSGHVGGREIAQNTEEQTQGVMGVVNSEEQLQKEKEWEEIINEARATLEEVRGNANAVGAIRENVQGNANAVEATLEEVRGNANAVGATLEEVQGNANAVETTLEEVRGNANAVGATLEEVRGNANAVGATLEEVQGNANAVGAIRENVQGNANAVETTLEEVRENADIVETTLETTLEDAKSDIQKVTEQLNEDYESLRFQISEVQGQIKAVAIVGSIVAVLATILLSPLFSKILALTEFSPDRLESRLKERIDKLEKKVTKENY